MANTFTPHNLCSAAAASILRGILSVVASHHHASCNISRLRVVIWSPA
jgi:hypothetical protein